MKSTQKIKIELILNCIIVLLTIIAIFIMLNGINFMESKQRKVVVYELKKYIIIIKW